MKQILIILIAMMFMFGCKQQGRSEAAGERVDEIIDNVKEGEAPLKHKGPVERLGESVDKMVDQDQKKDLK